MNVFTWQNEVLAPILYRDRFENWKSETAKIPGRNVNNPENGYAGALSYKTILYRGNENAPGATIGGLCVVYSGDLEYLMRGVLPDGSKITEVRDVARWSESLPRLDQILDSIGPTASDTYVCVFEDSLFARLIGNQLGLNEEELTKVFKGISERASGIIEEWLSISTGTNADFIPVYTSDIDDSLQKYVTKLADETGNKKILETEKSKINMMYTYLWPALLKEEGYLQDDCILCCEPFQHFVEVALPGKKGYYGIEDFLKDNPWGCGKNSQFQTAGFIPAMSLEGHNFSRQERYIGAINQSNAENKLQMIVQKGLNQPFPLNQNPILKESINLLYPFEDSRQLIKDAMDIEKSYKMKKGECKSKDGAARIKCEFSNKVADSLKELALKTEELYRRLGFVR